jgi:hypothetical protein
MLRRVGSLVTLLAIGALVAPVGAERTVRRADVTCQRVWDAIAAGKTPEEAAKTVGVSQARVKLCTRTRQERPPKAVRPPS